MDIKFTDRYDVLGIVRPAENKVCTGDCDGAGYYPVYIEEFDERGIKGSQMVKGLEGNNFSEEERKRWLAIHSQAQDHNEDGGYCDGWHFIKCPVCEGTGYSSI